LIRAKAARDVFDIWFLDFQLKKINNFSIYSKKNNFL
jgi:hypothetical protein